MRFILLTLTLFMATTASQTTIGDDSPKRSAELQVLDRFVGTWDMEVTIKPTGGASITSKGTETRKWSAGGKFVHFENANGDSPENSEFHMFVTYDPATKTYTGFMMFGTSRSLVNATWDPKSNTMTFNGTSPDHGGKFVTKHRFIDKDHSESSGVLTNSKGDVSMEQIHKQTRRSK